MAAALQTDDALARHLVRDFLGEVRRPEHRQRMRDAAAVLIPLQQPRDVVERHADVRQLAEQPERERVGDDPLRPQRAQVARRLDDAIAAGDALVRRHRRDDHGVVELQRIEHAARARGVSEPAAGRVVDDHRLRAISSAITMYFSLSGIRSKRKTPYAGSSFPVALR